MPFSASLVETAAVKPTASRLERIVKVIPLNTDSNYSLLAIATSLSTTKVKPSTS
jgi:hypothetical protein